MVPRTGIFELMGSSQLGVSEGYCYETPSCALLFYTEKQVDPTEEDVRELYSLKDSEWLSGGFLGALFQAFHLPS